MTDFTDPAPLSRRSSPSRKPPTIDLEATSGNEGEREAPASPESATVAQAAAAEPSDTMGNHAGPGDTGTRASERRLSGIGVLAGAGFLGGAVGAGLVLAVQAWLGPAPPDPRIEQIENRVEVLARGDAVRQAEERIAMLRDRLLALEQRLQETQRLAQQAASRAEEAMNRPIPAPAASAPQNPEALTDLTNRIAALEMQLGEGMQAAIGATRATAGQIQALERRATEQEQRIAVLSRQAAEGGSADAKAATRLVLANSLGNALRAGTPYQDILDGLRRSNENAMTLAPIELFAAKGAPNAAALARSFDPIGERIVREARGGSEDWSERFMRMMDRVVTIRPVDRPGMSSVPGLVARIEDALNRSAWADAVAAWDALPEPARRLSEDWGRQLKERAAAEAAAKKIAADALAALNQSSR